MKLNQKNIDIIKTAFSGKRLEKLKKSISILQSSEKLGSWIKGGSRSAGTGISQGIERNGYYRIKDYSNPKEKDVFSLGRSLTYGSAYSGNIPVKEAFNLLMKDKKIKVTIEQAKAWLSFCTECRNLTRWLDESRPLPVISDLGTSPKVKKTLEFMEMDTTESTLKYPELERKESFYFITDKDGQKIKKKHVWYKIIWEDGIVHNQSRFAGYSKQGHCRCDACGKPIPSGMLVPLEGKNKKTGDWQSMLVGTDCAKTLFGIKDVGIDITKQDIKK